VHDINVRQITASRSRAFNERLVRLKRDDLKPSLTEIARKVSSATPDLKDAGSHWQLKRAYQRTAERRNVVPKLLKDRALHQLRAQGADILNILQKRLKASGFRCGTLSYLGLKSILLNNVSDISVISGVLFKNFGKIHAQNYRVSL
jgi:hypothetical protein